jgi:hypothetical protein
VVSALDHVGSARYSRTGYLYPVIEASSVYGLLVGVSSGGHLRLPTGDILWRVDDQPPRLLRAADNPVPEHRGVDNAGDAAGKAVADTMALSSRLILAATATSTLASGDTARAMLAELRSGRGLLFRAAAASAAYGLSDEAMYHVGQYTREGRKPIALDMSLGTALEHCDIK